MSKFVKMFRKNRIADWLKSESNINIYSEGCEVPALKFYTIKFG